MSLVNSRATTKIFFKRNKIDTLRDEIRWNYIKFSIKTRKVEKEGKINQKKKKSKK